MKVVTFGELMVRLQPFNYERFVQANSLEFSFGGGEANVAVSLANYGLDAAFVTKLPAHAIGQAAVNSLRRYGVDTSMITRGGDRVGIYYNEKGASQRGSVCIYDRANSAIQLAQPSDFDWEKIFEGVDWFHFTGITPALGENVVEICREACKAAKAHGVKISCDLNYRGKLWTREQARAAMTDLCQYVDVCISNEEDAKDVFGIEAEATDIYGGKLNAEGYKSVAKQLADKFHFEKVAITLRESHSAFDNGWSAMLYDVASNEYCFSKKYDLHIIDRVGGAFNCSKAVLPDMIAKREGKIINICSMMSELGRETVSAYAAAKGALKMLTRNIASEYGEYNIQCNGMGPGYIATAQTAPLREIQPDGSRHPFDTFICAKTPAGRWGTPEDMVGPCVFLASHASDFVNGQILYADGGILAYIGKQPK